MRIIANILLLVGHAILIYYDVKLGITIKLIGSSMLIYFFSKLKYWDMVVTLSAFSSLEIFRLFL
jgi:hypothetical protein